MAGSRGEGAGEAQGAGATTTPNDGLETEEEHAAKIAAKLSEEADAAVAAAEAKVEKAKAHLEGAKQSLEDAKARRASLED